MQRPVPVIFGFNCWQSAHYFAGQRVSWQVPGITCGIFLIGAKNVGQLDENLAAVTLDLSADDLKRLDDISAAEPEYPG